MKLFLDVILIYIILFSVAFSHWYTNRAIKETQERRAKDKEHIMNTDMRLS